jgi:RNA polymerase sigma factor (sigma-70 family)
MPTGGLSEAVQQLRSIALRRDGAGATDAQLLEWFVAGGDEAAFAGLVRRHGPMVWGVCRRVLRGHHDAEDAFQATFLVLVRRAASVVPREQVANWLYGVAYQTARKARAAAARRRGRERQVTEMPEPAVVADPDPWRDARSVFDQALSQLPDKYRSAIVLCDLEGKSYKEAARHLGVPEGTLSGRLTRGRALLARRLARHGAALSGAALTALLSREAASAGVPPAVESSTIRAAGLLATGQAAVAGVVPAKVAALTEGVLKAMPMLKHKVVTAVVLVALVGGGMAHFHPGHPRAVAKAPSGETAVASLDAPSGDKPAAEPAAAVTPPVQSDEPAAAEPSTAWKIHDAVAAHLKHVYALLFGS